MSDQINWQDLEEAVGNITDQTKFAALQQTNEGGLRRLKLITGAKIRSWLAGLTQTINAVWSFVGGISLFEGPLLAAGKSINGAFTEGWYKVAVSDRISLRSIRGKLEFATFGSGNAYGTFGCEFGAFDRSSEPTQFIRLLPYAGPAFAISGILGFRLGYGTSLANNGYILEVKFATSTSIDGFMQLVDHIASSGVGFSLIDPVPTDGKLPDGSDALYLEAGEKLESVDAGTFLDTRISAYAASATSLRITITTDFIIKQNATTMTFPQAVTFRQSSGSVLYTIAAGTIVNTNTLREKTATGIIPTSGLSPGAFGFSASTGATVEFT